MSVDGKSTLGAGLSSCHPLPPPPPPSASLLRRWPNLFAWVCHAKRYVLCCWWWCSGSHHRQSPLQHQQQLQLSQLTVACCLLPMLRHNHGGCCSIILPQITCARPSTALSLSLLGDVFYLQFSLDPVTTSAVQQQLQCAVHSLSLSARHPSFYFSLSLSHLHFTCRSCLFLLLLLLLLLYSISGGTGQRQ